jgi:parvulin-like peptidyl-prolyl isomerase
MGIKNLVFVKREDAVEAIQKLNKGTDFAWLSANAQGQVAQDEQGLINFEGRPLTISSLPEDIQKALSGAKAGDFRLYASPAGHFYLLYVHQIIAPVQQPFDAVKTEIAKQVFELKVKAVIESWADQLRKYYPVKIDKRALAQLE